MGTLAKQAQSTQLQKKESPTEQLQAVLKKSWPRIAAVMPKEMSEQRLYQMYVSCINREPLLAECTVTSVLSCFMRCTALGLEPSNTDGLGRAYILPYGNKNLNGRKEATFMLGYKGMIDLARRSGELKSIHAQAVYKGDEFDVWEDETGQHFRFHANANAKHSEGTLTDVYVNAQLMNGGFVFEHMTKSEVDAIRARSKAGNSGPWCTDYEAMALKTVIRRSFKYLPVSTTAAAAAASDETTPDYSDVFHPTFPAEPEPEPVDVEPKPADVRKAKLEGITNAFHAIGIGDEKGICETISQIIGHSIGHVGDLTDEECDKVMADLQGGLKGDVR